MKFVKFLCFVIALLLSVKQLPAQSTTADSLTGLIKTTKTPIERYKLLNKLNGYYMQRGQADSMKNATKSMLSIAQQLHNDTLLIQSYIAIGNYLVAKADFEASLEFYFKALHLAEEAKLTPMIITLYNNIGGEYEDLQNFSEALKYVKRERDLMSGLKNKGPMEVFMNWHLAHDYLNLNVPDSALYYNKLANAINSKSARGQSNMYIHAHIYWTFGQVYQQLNNKTLADQYYKKAISFSDSLQLNTPLVLALNSYSKYLFNNGDLESAKTNALRALKLAQSIDFRLEVINAAGSLSKIYTKLNMPGDANHFFQLKDSIQHETLNQQRINRLQDITYTEQIHQAEERAKQAELEEHRRHNIQYAGIAIAIISFAVFFLLLSRSTVVRPRFIEFLGVVGLLIVFEFINLIMHPFIGAYTHESPLLMLVVMVAVAALLVPLHHRLEEYIKHKLLARKPQIKNSEAQAEV